MRTAPGGCVEGPAGLVEPVLDEKAARPVGEAREEPELFDGQRRMQAPDHVRALDPFLGGEVVEIDPEAGAAVAETCLDGVGQAAAEGLEGERGPDAADAGEVACRNLGLEGVPVGDADAAHERVRGGGVEVVREPREHVDGVDDERDGQAEVAQALGESPGDARVAEVVDDAAEDDGACGRKDGVGGFGSLGHGAEAFAEA